MKRLPASLAAVSIRQPWASLLAMGAIHRCSMPAEMKHRGLIAVHASGRDSYVDAAGGWNDLLANASAGRTPLVFPLPQTAVIAVGEIVDCVPDPVGWELILTDVRRAQAPLPTAGQIGVWTWQLPNAARDSDFWRAVEMDDGHV